MHSRGILVAAALAAVVVSTVAGCAGSEDPKGSSSPSTPSTSVTGPGSNQAENLETGEKFVAALAAGTPDSLAEAAALTAPKSGAARYLAAVRRELAAGQTGPQAVTVLGTGRYQLCGGDDCSVLRDVVLVDGKVTTFKVDGQQIR